MPSIIIPSWVERRQIGGARSAGNGFGLGRRTGSTGAKACAREHGERIVAEEAVYNRLPELYARWR
jgi:hypothetical protein